MEGGPDMTVLERARHAAGMSQSELARRASTSRPTLSAYENGRKSPTLATLERLLAETGFALTIEPVVVYAPYPGPRGAVVWVPNHLPRLEVSQALGVAELPLHLHWSAGRSRRVDLADPHQRARCYEVVLREGSPTDIATYIDGALLADAWPSLVLPRTVREAWTPLIQTVRP
jgi:transcriptional regulator with XRE-family HTH domain